MEISLSEDNQFFSEIAMKDNRIFVTTALILFLVIGCKSSIFKSSRGIDTIPQSFYFQGSHTLPYLTDTIEIDFENRLPITVVYINGRPYRFLMDTGALTVISHEIYEDLDLEESYRGYFNDINNRSRLTSYTVIPDLRISNTTFNDIGAVVLDISEPLSCFYDGIVGANLMAKLHWKFDYQNKMAIVSDNKSEIEIQDPDHIWPFITSNQQTPYLNAGLLQRRGLFMFDTGASHGIHVTNHYDFYKSEVDSSKFITRTGIQSFGVYGPGNEVKSFIMETDIIIAEDTLENAIVSGGSKTLLGNDFLKNYLFAIDWTDRKITLKRNETIGISRQNLYEGFGYTAYFINDKLRVINLIEEANLPLALGDEIIRINQTDFSAKTDIDICDYIRVGEQSDLSEKNITVVRENDTLSFNLEKQLFY